jgi:hypothetical protein
MLNNLQESQAEKCIAEAISPSQAVLQKVYVPKPEDQPDPLDITTKLVPLPIDPRVPLKLRIIINVLRERVKVLLSGAKVVETPETTDYYEVDVDPRILYLIGVLARFELGIPPELRATEAVIACGHESCQAKLESHSECF